MNVNCANVNSEVPDIELRASGEFLFSICRVHTLQTLARRESQTQIWNVHSTHLERGSHISYSHLDFNIMATILSIDHLLFAPLERAVGREANLAKLLGRLTWPDVSLHY